MDKPLKSITHGHPLTSTKLLTEAHVCERLAQVCYLKVQGRDSNPRPSEAQVQCPDHYATRPRYVDVLLQGKSPLQKVDWLRVVLDEGHTVRNPKTLMTKAVLALNAQRKWVVTGESVRSSSTDSSLLLLPPLPIME